MSEQDTRTEWIGVACRTYPHVYRLRAKSTCPGRSRAVLPVPLPARAQFHSARWRCADPESAWRSVPKDSPKGHRDPSGQHLTQYDQQEPCGGNLTHCHDEHQGGDQANALVQRQSRAANHPDVGVVHGSAPQASVLLFLLSSAVALLSSCLKKHGHPLPIRPLSTVTRLGSTATREYNQAPTCAIFIGGGTAAVVPWQMGVYCRGVECPVTVLRI